ncbi:MAG: ABC transporter substrate-binding protein, partial [Acidimicrobiia bacterium]
TSHDPGGAPAPSPSGISPSGGTAPAGAHPGASTSAAGAASAQGEIRLASLGVGSGPLGAVMKPIPDAVRAWVASVNDRGGLGGHHVRLLVGDDGGDPSRALTLARQFVEQEKIDAFLGTHMVTTEQAITDYVDQKRVPIIGTCNCSAGNDGSPMVFFFGPSATKGLAWSHLAPLATLAQAKKVAFLYCREAPQCSAAAQEARVFAPQAGMQVVYEAQVSLAQPDYTAEAISAKNAGAEAVAVFADNQTAMRFIRSANRQGWQPAVSTQQSGYDERMLKVAESEGLYTSAIVPDLFTDPRLAGYRQALQRIPGAVRATIGASTFVVGQLLEKLAPALPADPGPEDFVRVMEGLRGETMGGLFPPITFRPGAAHEDTNRCVIPAMGRIPVPVPDLREPLRGRLRRRLDLLPHLMAGARPAVLRRWPGTAGRRGADQDHPRVPGRGGLRRRLGVRDLLRALELALGQRRLRRPTALLHAPRLLASGPAGMATSVHRSARRRDVGVLGEHRLGGRAYARGDVEGRGRARRHEHRAVAAGDAGVLVVGARPGVGHGQVAGVEPQRRQGASGQVAGPAARGLDIEDMDRRGVLTVVEGEIAAVG